MPDEMKITPILPREWKDGEIELFENGLIRYQTMTRAEFERKYPRPSAATHKGMEKPE